MSRLPLSGLEDALSNPAAYRRSLDAGKGYEGGETYAGALRHAVFRYHSRSNRDEAYQYLDRRLAESQKLRNAARIAETLDRLEWYIADHQARGWTTFQCGLRLIVPVPRGAEGDVVCSGEIGRMDLVPSGGYAGWVMSGTLGTTWADQLRFPLIQQALADVVLGVPPSEVSVGVCDFEARQMRSRCYSVEEIDAARRRFGRLLAALGFGRRPS